METLKKIGKALLFPHIAIVFIIVPFAFFLLGYAAILVPGTELIHIVSYVASAYALTIFCCRVPQMIRFFKKVRQENKYVVRYFSDTHLRINISLYISLAINTAYALLQFGMGLTHSSIWFYSLCVYYLLLAVMRFFLLKHTRTHETAENSKLEWLIYRFCGVLLLLMNSTLGAMVFYMTWQGRTFRHHQITTIAMAAYTFFTLTKAIIQVVKFRKYKSPVYSATKVVGLTSALVSMLTLENAMLTAFSESGQETFILIMNGATGGVVTSTVLVIAIYMIVNSTKQIKIFNLQEKEASA
ncbi:MAG: hypothetical protein IJ324_05710 [Lachnospiraceae bacterium]|nr:hypothetical protein [Lachnospiraceae bacterium]